MKKNYLKPQIEVISVSPSHLLEGSLTGSGTSISNSDAEYDADARGGDFFDED